MIKRVTSIEEVKIKSVASSTEDVFTPNIAVIGIGGAGVNALNNLINMNMTGIKFIVANTDVKSLDSSACKHKIRLGLEITKGLGAGSKPEIGRQAAEESVDEIRSALKDIDLLFMVAGMGGGTGTGASQVIAKIAKDLNILTLGFVTKPFAFEGKQRAEYAESGIFELQKYIDSLVIISNQNLFKVINENTSMVEAFRIMDNVIYSGVKAISDLIMSNGMVNLDFNDIKSVIEGGGKAMVTSIEVAGSDRVAKVTEGLINNPLIDNNVNLLGASNILINITGGVNMTLFEVDKIVNSLRDKANKDTYINFGAIFDERMAENIRVAIVATGISDMGYNRSAGYAPKELVEEEKSFFVEAVKTPPIETASPVVNREIEDKNSGFAAENPAFIRNFATETPVPQNTPMVNNYTSGLPANNYVEQRSSSGQVEENKPSNNNLGEMQKQMQYKENIQENKNTSLFNLIEKHPEDDSEDDLQESINSLGAGNPKSKSNTGKSFFDLPPFLRQKK